MIEEFGTPSGLDFVSEREVGELSSALRRAIRRRGIDAETAEDVVQEAWLRTLRTPPPSRDPRGLSGWLHVVGMRLVAELRRARTNRTARERASARPEAVSVALDEDSRLLARMLELPEPYREVLRLRFLEDLETDEIGARLGRPAVTVRSQLARGLERLRRRLDEREEPRGLRALGAALVARVRSALRAVRPAGAWPLVVAGVLLVIGVPLFLLLDADATAGALHARALAAAPDRVAPSAAGAGQARRAVPGGVQPLAGAAAETATRARVVSGRVLAPDGAPAAFAELHAGGRTDAGAPVGAADAAGAFAVVLPADAEFLWARVVDACPSRRVLVGSLPEGAAHELVLAPSRGTVELAVYAADGRPAVGVAVTLSGEQGRGPASAIARSGALEVPFAGAIRGATDARGRVVLAKPDCDAAGVRVSRTADDEARGTALLVGRLALSEGDESLTLVLPLPAALGGVVLDPLGRPARGARVLVRQFDSAVVARATTDAEGRFQVAGLLPGDCHVSAEAEGTAVLARAVLTDGERAEVRLELSGAAALAGRALDAAGAPLAGARVAVYRAGRPGQPADAELVTDAEGRFQCAAAPDVEYALELALPGADLPCGWLAPVRAGEPVELAAEPRLAERLPLALELVGPEPGRVPTLAVLRTAETRISLEVPVDPASGRVTAELPPLAYELVVFLPGAGAWRAPEPVTPGAGVQRVAVPRPAVVRLDIGAPPVAPSPSIHAAIEVGGFNPFGFDAAEQLGAFACARELEPDAGGLVFSGEVFPGRHAWTVHTPGSAPAKGRFRAVAGELVAIPVELASTGAAQPPSSR